MCIWFNIARILYKIFKSMEMIINTLPFFMFRSEKAPHCWAEIPFPGAWCCLRNAATSFRAGWSSNIALNQTAGVAWNWGIWAHRPSVKKKGARTCAGDCWNCWVEETFASVALVLMPWRCTNIVPNTVLIKKN